MEQIFSYDFLKIEFKDIYNDIEGLRKNTTDDVERILNILIGDIVFCICKKENILYGDIATLNQKINMVKEKGLIPDNILDKIISWINRIQINYLTNMTPNDDKIELKLLYEILAWFVVNYGNEDYSLLEGNLKKEEQEIFEKYLLKNDNDKIFETINIEDLSEEVKNEKGRALLEKGENYYLGRGVKPNNVQALRCFREAVKYGNVQAKAYIAVFYERGIVVGKSNELAAKWYRKAAIAGSPFAQYSLAMCYVTGNGVLKDRNRALMWFQKSAENEYPPAYYQLGRLYYYGIGVDKDNIQAFKWYTKAAESNFPEAQYALAMMYKNGKGCEANIVTACYWLEKAAENENEDAYYIMGRLYTEGIVHAKDYEKAYYYLNKGYLMGDTNCIEALGNMYLNGWHVKKDRFKALELFNQAIELGYDELYYKVGKIYEEEGLINQAIDIYEEGHEAGQVKCTQRLGVIYYNGEGISRNVDKAIEYMELATKQKAPHAMYMLAIAYLRTNKFGDETEKKSKELLFEAFELGSPYAAEYLGYITINEATEGKKIDEDKLLEYIEYGIKNNISACIFQYGYIYEYGIAVDVNYEKAFGYYKSAEDKRCIKAMLKLADWYKFGRYLEQNIDYAINL